MPLKEGEDPELYVIIFGTNSFFSQKNMENNKKHQIQTDCMLLCHVHVSERVY